MLERLRQQYQSWPRALFVVQAVRDQQDLATGDALVRLSRL
jgi:hypothetical protein